MKENTIEKLNKENCTGCGACYNKCPVSAIDMVFDSEGFIYPRVNQELCVNCKQCQKVCPELNVEKAEVMKHREGICYAMMAENEIRKVSSSGGMFTLMANTILEAQGIVYGSKTYSN